MAAVAGPHRIAACLVGLAASWLLQPVAAKAFPIDDPLHPSIIPAGGELAPSDVQDLQHQMDRVSGFTSLGQGWTVIPRITVEEVLNDNIFQAQEPRRADLITTLAPGVAVAGHTNRVQLQLDYQPTLQFYARTGSEDALTHQLSATGLVTVVPDLLFVDVRGLAGVQATLGGIGGLGTLGFSNFVPITPTGFLQTTQLGLSKQSLTQSSSFAVSPYLLHQFGDAGTGKLGISLSQTSLSRINGFTAAPWATGQNAQHETGIEETASFQTGGVFSRIRDTVQADAAQFYSTTLGQSGNSNRENIVNRVDYALDQSVVVYGQLGWERINYTGPSSLEINGPIWGVGTTFTPSEDTSVTLGYGHQQGSTSFSFNGRYAATARTTLTGSYGTSIGSQTSLLSSQLSAAAVSSNGTLVNSQTSGPLFLANNALGLSPGLFRFTSLSLGATTTLERDTITVTVSHSTQTPVGSGIRGVSSEATTGGVTWTHEVNPDLRMTAALYYSIGTPSGGIHQNSVAAELGGQYTLSETVSAFARYAFLGRRSSEAALSMYQDLLIVGITKQF